MRPPIRSKRRSWLAALAVFLPAVFHSLTSAPANIPGGGTGSGPNVTLVDNGDGTFTMDNGIVAINIGKANARLNSIKYTYNNNGSTRTTEVLWGPGQYYWGGFNTVVSTGAGIGFNSGPFTYSTTVDPSGNQADVKFLRDNSTHIGPFEAHFTMRRGSQGFYTTGILSHGPGDVPVYVGAFGNIIGVAGTFNWLSADSARSFAYGTISAGGYGGPDIPKESAINISGGLIGEYRNKFSTALDHGDQRAWGYSSVGPAGTNISIWQTANLKYNVGGPLKRDDGAYITNTLAHQIMTQEIGQGTDSRLAQDEVWSKTCGPWFNYVKRTPL